MSKSRENIINLTLNNDVDDGGDDCDGDGDTNDDNANDDDIFSHGNEDDYYILGY